MSSVCLGMWKERQKRWSVGKVLGGMIDSVTTRRNSQFKLPANPAHSTLSFVWVDWFGLCV